MKKITFLLVMLIAWSSQVSGQCTNTSLYPSDPVPANNLGVVQEINSCVFTGDYSVISDITPGGDYIFTCIENFDSTEKYITVKDNSGAVLAHGMSPLTVNGINVSTIQLHYSESSACDTEENCNTVTLLAVLSCPIPTSLQINGITTTASTFSWTAGGAETAWQVMLVPFGTTPPTAATMGTDVILPTYTNNTLAVGGHYKFYVRANCGTEYSPWGGPYAFYTACASTALFTENFDTTELDEVPACWTAIVAGAATEASVGTVTFMANSGDKAIQLSNDNSQQTSNILLVSPPLTTMATGTHRVKFYGRGYGNVVLEVGTVNSMSADATFTLRETINLTGFYQEYVVDFTGYVGGNTFLAFRHPSIETSNPIFLDDIRWEAAPLCPDVKNIIVAGLTPASATIAWQAGGGETQWDVVYGDATVTDPDLLFPITPAPTVNPTALISGLSPNIEYKAWIRSVCGGTAGNGAWIGPISFTTSCLATNLITENFNTTNNGELPNCWTSVMFGEELAYDANIEVVTNSGIADTKAVRIANNDSGTESTLMLVSPNLSTLSAGTHRLKFFARTQGEGAIDVGTITTPAQGGVFSNIETVTLTDDYAEYVVSFTGYIGPNTYVAIKHSAGVYVSIYLDNIRWEVEPLCGDVTNITVAGITASSAIIGWLPNSTETQWDVVYALENVTDPVPLIPITPAPTNTPDATITGLLSNTRYNVWVRSACGGAIGNGAWIGPVVFETACLPVATFNEGMETTDAYDVPNCWTGLTYGPNIPEYAAVRTVNYASATGENSIELWPDNIEVDDYVMLVSPQLSTLAAGTHRLRFAAFSYDPATIVVGTLSEPNQNGVFTPFETVSTTDPYGVFTLDFSGYVGTDTYIAFRNVTSGKSIFLDNMKWEPIPACPDVENITISQVATNSVIVNWSAGNETGWQVAYGAMSVTDPLALIPSAVIATPTFPLSSLTDDESYKVWVRSVCTSPNGNGNWIGPIVFHTLCTAGTVPYTQDFEGSQNIPNCTLTQNTGDGSTWLVRENPGFGFSSNALVYAFDDENDANAWFYTRGLTLVAGATYTVKYTYGNNSSDNYVESMSVSAGETPDEVSMVLLADHPEINTGAPTTNEVEFMPATSGVYYFGFRAYSIANQYDLYLDNISVTATPLSTNEFEQNSFTYYPNPVKDVLTLSYNEDISNVAVYNLLGQTVIVKAMNQKEARIDMSALPAGNYLVKVTSGSMTKTIKILKG